MQILGFDVGSSSVKAAVLENGAIRGVIARCAFPTRFEDVRAEVDARAVLKAMTAAVKQIGPATRKVDAIGLATMGPSWIAMDARGRAITPIVTHQDRRSVEIARELERRVGKVRHLQLAGNRPFPGGISSTTLAWYLQHRRDLMRKADVVGHLTTYLHRQMTGARVTDPSHASFMGLYTTLKLSDWNETLCEAVGVSRKLLPEIRPADEIGGYLTADAARRLGLTAGTPVMVGMMDGSAAMLLVGAGVGQLLNVCGSTDVLGLCTDRPKPHEQLLTRAVGIGRRWMSVSTLAAAGSALLWAHGELFPDLSREAFNRLMLRLAKNPQPSAVRFEPYLAGDRMSIEQRQGAFTGLTLSSTRQQMLGAIIESLAQASAERLPLLQQGGTKIRREVVLSGGVQGGLDRVMHRDWPGRWTFQVEMEATLRGLGAIEPRPR